jgi:hypothetical protein
VREEASLDHRTMEICLVEIARCQKTGIKPNFIVLLGDRYGWRPLPARIEKNEFEAVLAHVADASDRDFVQSWYDLDLNAVPPEYLLFRSSGQGNGRISGASDSFPSCLRRFGTISQVHENTGPDRKARGQ